MCLVSLEPSLVRTSATSRISCFRQGRRRRLLPRAKGIDQRDRAGDRVNTYIIAVRQPFHL